MNLEDAYRHLDQNTLTFTSRKKNAKKQARLDYFLISESMLNVVQQCNIKSSYHSDHSIIEMCIKVNPFTKGKGLWKFNTSLLKNKDYLDLVKDIIVEKSSSIPCLFIHLNLLKNANKHLYLKIDDDDILENLLLLIGGESIKSASCIKNNRIYWENTKGKYWYSWKQFRSKR